jgi:hypothetical protein
MIAREEQSVYAVVIANRPHKVAQYAEQIVMAVQVYPSIGI